METDAEYPLNVKFAVASQQAEEAADKYQKMQVHVVSHSANTPPLPPLIEAHPADKKVWAVSGKMPGSVSKKFIHDYKFGRYKKL